MIYLWEASKNCLNKFTGACDRQRSPHYLLLLHGKKITAEEFGRCNLYIRSTPPISPDDPFIRCELTHNGYFAYVFTSNEMFYFNGILVKIGIDQENLNNIKKKLRITDNDLDKPLRSLTDEELEFMGSISGHPVFKDENEKDLMIRYRGISVAQKCPEFSRVPIINFNKTTKEQLQKRFDCLPNNYSSPLINQKIVDILAELAPNDVQFFDTEVRCQGEILPDYKILNIASVIKGIDHRKSIPNSIGFNYLTYIPGCMGKHKITRDDEYIGNILVTEEIKQAFEKAKIKGVRFVRPEEYYRPLRPEDLTD
jgi:hypothetical protein